MPFNFGAALQSGLAGQLGGLFGGTGTTTATNGTLSNLDLKGITLEDIQKTIKSLPPRDRKRDLKIALPPKICGAISSGSSIFDATVAQYETVTIPANVVYMISANNVYSLSNIATPVTTSATDYQSLQISYPMMQNIYGQMLGNIYPSYGSVVTYGMGENTPTTPEQRAAWVKSEAERAEKRTNAVKRAEGLLFTILKPEQVRQYSDLGYFETEVDDRLYRIHKRSHSGNVELIVGGKAIAKYCAHPTNCYETPEVDTMISQLLMLQTDEQKFLKMANRTVLM